MHVRRALGLIRDAQFCAPFEGVRIGLAAVFTTYVSIEGLVTRMTQRQELWLLSRWGI